VRLCQPATRPPDSSLRDFTLRRPADVGPSESAWTSRQRSLDAGRPGLLLEAKADRQTRCVNTQDDDAEPRDEGGGHPWPDCGLRSQLQRCPACSTASAPDLGPIWRGPHPLQEIRNTFCWLGQRWSAGSRWAAVPVFARCELSGTGDGSRTHDLLLGKYLRVSAVPLRSGT
jgi:hypothetical protein